MTSDLYQSDLDRHLFAPGPRAKRRGQGSHREQAARLLRRAWGWRLWRAVGRRLRTIPAKRKLAEALARRL